MSIEPLELLTTEQLGVLAAGEARRIALAKLTDVEVALLGLTRED
jgi:ABC-type transport system involved in cytochrome c biogenesis ATPase subunit